MPTNLSSACFCPVLGTGASCSGRAGFLKDAHEVRAHHLPCPCHDPSQTLPTPCANTDLLWFTTTKPTAHTASLHSGSLIMMDTKAVPVDHELLIVYWEWVSNSGWGRFLHFLSTLFMSPSMLGTRSSCNKYLFIDLYKKSSFFIVDKFGGTECSIRAHV